MTSTNDYESVLNDLFALEEATTPVGVTGSGSDKTDKKQWKDYPSEKPRKDELVAWIEAWSDDLTQAGYAPLLRGEEPFELQKYAQRDMLADDGTNPAILAKNADIKHANDQNAKTREAQLTEIKVRAGSRLAAAMRKTAPLKLKVLFKKFGFRDKETNELMVPPIMDGIAGFKELCTDVDDEVSEYDALRYERAHLQPAWLAARLAAKKSP